MVLLNSVSGKLPPRKIPPPWENYPQCNPLPTYKSYKWKKKTKLLSLQSENDPKNERKRKSPRVIYLPVVQVK